MSLKTDQERLHTQNKLARLVKRHEALSAETGGDDELRQMTIESLRVMIRQLQEEIVRYDAHRGAPRGEAARA